MWVHLFTRLSCTNSVKWDINDNPRYNCGELQEDEHLFKCSNQDCKADISKNRF